MSGNSPNGLAWSARHQICSADQIRQLARAKINMRRDLARRTSKIEHLDGRPEVVERAGQYLIVRIGIHHESPVSAQFVKLTLNSGPRPVNPQAPICEHVARTFP